MKNRIALGTSLVAVIVFAFAGGVVSQGSESMGQKAIEGSWKIVVTPDPAPPGVPPPPPPFGELITFTSNGGLVETNTVFRPSEATPGHGSWRFAANRTYHFTFIKFLFDAQGQFSGHLRVRGQVKLDSSGDQWSGVGAVDIFDPAGNFIAPLGTVTAQGIRLPVEPM